MFVLQSWQVVLCAHALYSVSQAYEAEFWPTPYKAIHTGLVCPNVHVLFED